MVYPIVFQKVLLTPLQNLMALDIQFIDEVKSDLDLVICQR